MKDPVVWLVYFLVLGFIYLLYCVGSSFWKPLTFTDVLSFCVLFFVVRLVRGGRG